MGIKDLIQKSSIFSGLFLGIFTLCGVHSASATVFNYNFVIGDKGFGQGFVDFSNPVTAQALANSRYYFGSGTGSVAYDDVAQTVVVDLVTVGDVYGYQNTANGFQWDPNNKILTGINASAHLTFSNVTAVTNPNGLFSPAGSISGGNVQIDTLGLGQGGGIFYTVGAMAMALPQYAALGSGNYFQFNEIDTWLHNTSCVSFAGLADCFNVSGDLHGVNLSPAIPEPATMGLLAMGLFGGAISRRKLSSSKE